MGQAKQIEGIKISLQDKAVSFAGSSIQYRTYHLRTLYWQDWTSSSPRTEAKPGSGKRVEAVQIKLTGSIASSYDVYYRSILRPLASWTGPAMASQAHKDCETDKRFRLYW